MDSVTSCRKQVIMERITLSDRTAIEAGLYGRLTFKQIANKIGKSTKAVSREIRKNCTKVKGVHPRGNDCWYAAECKRKNLCGKDACHRRCVYCSDKDCRTLCSRYTNKGCSQLSKPPYVCNVCGSRRKCKLDRAYYIATQADAIAKRRYSNARCGPHVRGDEMTALDDVVSPLILKGQPLTHIYATHGDELPVSQRTLYNYIGNGRLSIGNLDLRRKVGYRPRKKKDESSEGFENLQFRRNRTYQHFERFLAQNPGIPYVEMDTVRGVREQGKRMLTMIFVENDLLLMLLMPDGTGDSIIDQFDWLTDALGLDTFRELFPAILTDNGSEFKRVKDLEETWDKQKRTRIFYCDPQASWQKPHIEKNHEFIRYVLPKGKSLNPYTQEDMAILMSHINSTRRKKLKGNSPYEMANTPAFQKLKKVLDIREIPADEVNLKPEVLRRSDI